MPSPSSPLFGRPFAQIVNTDVQTLLEPSVAPHLVLGIVSGCTQDEAVAAFARRSRRVKTDQDSPFDIEDLTTALAQIQQGNREGAVSLRYAIPCNPLAYNPDASVTLDGATLTAASPVANLLSLQPPEHLLAEASSTLLAAAIQAVLEWDWTAAKELAKECLRISADEDVRDEALNVFAAALAMLGESQKALQALQRAVEGKWNLNLQANLGILATSQDPRLAASQMSYLIDGATTADEKLRATRVAIKLWHSAQEEGLDEEEFEPLPAKLLSSIYDLLQTDDLEEEDFFELGTFLARIDGESTALAVALTNAPLRNSPSARVIAARRNDFMTYVEALVRAAVQDMEHTRPWIQSNLDDWVRTVNSALTDRDKNGSGVHVAFNLLENGIDCSSFARIAMRFLMISRLFEVLDQDGVPSEQIVKWYVEARNATTIEKYPSEQFQVLRDIGVHAGNTLGALTHIALAPIYVKVENAANSVLHQMSSLLRWVTADRSATRSISQTVVGACKEAIRDYDRVLPYVTDEDIHPDMWRVRNGFSDVLKRIEKYA